VCLINVAQGELALLQALRSERADELMGAHPTVLAILLEDRGLHRYGSFCAAYQKAAFTVDKQLAHTVPSRAQFHRWLAGDLRGLPYTDHCMVLEYMLTGYSAQQLFTHCTDGAVPMPARAGLAAEATKIPDARVSAVGGLAGVAAVFTSRSEFAAAIPPRSLFDGAQRVRAAGLSLNLVCQQVPDQYLRQWLAAGGELSCLFLDPDGEAIKAREAEEEHPAGFLSALTRLNIDVLARFRDRLPAADAERLRIAVYDETIRFNLILADEHTCVAQPYLPTARGVDSPTMLIRATSSPGGLLPVFEQVFQALAERSKPA
jgi:uncharacterized protein DUF5919